MTFTKRPNAEENKFMDMVEPNRTKVLYIRAPEALWYDLKTMSKESHWSMNDLCLKMLREGVEDSL